MSFEAKYIPIIKTTDAEMRGYQELSSEVKDKIIPIFELTKSRKTLRVPEGDIHRRMNKIEEIVEDRPFVLDLTTHDSLSNTQIQNLLDEQDGFRNWFDFLSEYDHLNIYPVVHAYEDDDLSEITLSARNLREKFGKIAFRSPFDDSSLDKYLEAILNGAGSTEDLLLVIDCGYVGHPEAFPSIASTAASRLDEARSAGSFGGLAVASSGFPKSVTQHPDGNDSLGALPMDEVRFFEALRLVDDYPLIYSDYASIHPKRYDARGGTWVPRVDVPLDDKYIYTRYRRDDGGYVRAARHMLQTDEYEAIGCWGDHQIDLAASDRPEGLSPSFWIAVRLNIHATRKANNPPKNTA